jgi:hypothetical protein
MSQPDSKARILNAFQTILAERQKIESRVATKEQEATQQADQRILETVSQYTQDGIVRGLADLQLEFGGIVSGLTARLITENQKLAELQRAIAVETEHLQELQQTRTVADALHILTQEHQEKLASLEKQHESEIETLEKAIAEARKLWQQEQEEFEAAQLESETRLQEERDRQEADHAYEIEQARKIAADEYAEKNRQQEYELQQSGENHQKQWTEREQVLTTNQTQLQEYQRKVEAFPAELDEAVKKAREEGIRDVNQDAKVKADLLEREWQGTKQGYDFQIISLEAKIQKQTEQITELSTQLQAAMRQAQELAMRAFETSSNRIASKNE